jgi:hypothetical protein
MLKLKQRKRAGGERGYSLLLATLGMTGVLGFTGMALDFSYYYSRKRVMQTAADAGALAGAHEVFRQKTSYTNSSALAATAANGFTHNSAGVTVTVNHPPTSGYHTGDTQYVEVVVSQPTPSMFLRIFNLDSATITARAVAGKRPFKPAHCIYALNPVEEKTFTVTSQSRLNATCSIQDNGTPYNAFNVESGSTVQATAINVVGGSNITSGSVATPSPSTGMASVADPLASLEPPAVSSCSYNNKYVVSSATATLNPGVYCQGIEIGSGSTVTFNPGLYILKDGGLLVASQSRVTGAGVTFFNTGGEKYQPIRFESGSFADLSAPTSGQWAGLLFYQDRNAGKPGDKYYNQVASSGLASFIGTMYFPTQYLTLAASNTTTTIEGMIIASVIEVASNSNVAMSGFPSTMPPPTSKVTMME